MTGEPHDPASWPLSPTTRDTCNRITTHLIELGWRPLGTIYAPELVAAHGDPTARARIEIRPDPAYAGQLTVRLLRLSYPTVEAGRPEPLWHLLITGPVIDAQVVVRAAHTAPDQHPVADDPLSVAARRHGWRPPVGDAADTRYTRAVSPDGRTTLTFGPYDALFTGQSAPEPWHAEARDEQGESAWTLTACKHLPAQVLYAALLTPQPAHDLAPGPQHRLHELLTTAGFTAYPWQQIELGGSATAHLADVYLHHTPGSAVALTVATTGIHHDPEVEVAAFGGGADLHDACCARARQSARGGHAFFSRHVPPQAVLAYVGALTAPR